MTFLITSEKYFKINNIPPQFCIDGDYGNVTKLERRLQDLGTKDSKIKQYLRGEDPMLPNKSLMGDYSLDEVRGYFQNGKFQQDDQQRRGQFKKDGDMIDQMKDIKKEKHLLRMRKDQDEDDLVALLKDMEQRKELELRAQIEKEEIQRNLRDLDKKQLSALERDRKKELERLAVERENLRMREQSMMDEVKKMEQQLLEQEKFFRKQKETSERDPNAQFAMNDIRRKELDLARERGEKIVQIKAQRDRLEKERGRILDDLDKVKSGNLTGLRKNDAARFAGESMRNLGSIEDFRADKFQSLEPSIKDKLINDTVRVNYLREQQRKTLNEMLPEIDELDILQKEMENRNFVNEATQMVNEYDGRMTPNRPLYLSTIRQKLEQQAAGPSSFQNGNGYNNTQYQADLPDHIPGGEGKKVMLNNLKDLKDEYLTKGGEDQEFITKLNDLESFLNYKKDLPKRDPFKPGYPPQVSNLQVTSNQPPMMAPQGFPSMHGYPPPMGVPPLGPPGMSPYGAPFMGGMPPQMMHDPMMLQMNQMLSQQEDENKKLREALEGITSGTGPVNQFDGIINQTTQELEELKSKILPGGLGLMGGDEEEPFPEDFVFRQNEFRCEDLEVEERALMNLTSQEYDALRVISKLPVNSELYRYKMDQYKELSTMRAEIEKVLQEQRLEKIRRDFEKQKYEDERRFKHEKWLEDQKRQILEAKLKNAGRNQQYPEQDYQQPMTAGYQQPMSQQQRRQEPMNQSFNGPPPLTSNSQGQQQPIQTPNTGNPQQRAQQQPMANQNYDPNMGFNLMVDLLFNLPREHRSMRLVYSVFLEKKTLVEPRLIEVKQAEADMENPNFNKVFFNANQLIKHVKQHPAANLIIEFQIPDPNKTAGYSSLGWTILNVFDANYNLKPQTIVDLDVRDIYKLKPMLNLLLCIRIAMPRDEIYAQQPSGRTNPVNIMLLIFVQGMYNLPNIHDINRQQQQPEQQMDQNQRNPVQRKQSMAKSQNQIPLDRNTNDRIVNPPSELNQRDQNYEISGIQLFIHYLKNLKNYQKVKIQATLYEGVNIVKQDNYQDCNWATQGVEKSAQMLAPRGSKIEIGLDGQIEVFKPSYDELNNPREYGQNQVGVLGQDEFLLPMNQETSWQKDLYNMLWDHGCKDNLHLLLQVFIVIPKAGSQLNTAQQAYEPIGYTVFQVNNDDGTIRFGTFENALYRMPINLFKQDPGQALPVSIKFSLIQPRMNPLSAKQKLPDRFMDSRGKPHSQQFIPNFEKQYTPSEDFQPGDGIDVYVDWARFLPDNSMFSKVFVRVIDVGMGYPQPGQRGFASLEYSTGRNPFFGFKYEIRDAKINPTLMLLVSFETIDKSNGQPCYAGHSYFPLFMDKGTTMPITDPNSRVNIQFNCFQSITLHQGFYQMPVFSQFPLMQAPFTYQNFIYLERVPTASMLVRIYKAPKMPDGTVMGLDNTPQEKWADADVLIQAPVYQEGIYNTQYFLNTPLENRLFYIRKGRKDPKLADVLDQMIIMAKQNPSLVIFLFLNLQPEDQKLEIADRMIDVGQNPIMIDMNYFSQYSSEFGFRAGVEAIHNNSQAGFFGVILSVCPTAQFYDPTRQGPAQDVLLLFIKLQCVAITGQDFESTTHTTRFSEGEYVFKNIKETPGMCLIYDIKIYQSGKNQFENYGFSIFPLFSQIIDRDTGMPELYVNSGIYSLPIFQGSLTPDILKSIKDTRNCEELLGNMQQMAKLKSMQSSLIVKVVDGQRERHFDKGLEVIPPRNKFLPRDLLEKLKYQPLTVAQASKQKKLNSLIPRGESVMQFQQFLQDFIHTQYKL